MADSNEKHKIASGEDGQLILIPNPVYRPPPPAPAASSPQVEMSGATAAEPMVIDSSDDDSGFDFNSRTHNIAEASTTSPIKLDSGSEEEDELDANEGTVDAPAFVSRGVEGNDENGRGFDDDEEVRWSSSPIALDIFEEEQDLGAARLGTPADEQPTDDTLTSEAHHRSPSSTGTSEIFNVDWDADDIAPIAQALSPNAYLSEADQHSPSSPSTSEIFRDKSDIPAPASSESDIPPDTPNSDAPQHLPSSLWEPGLADDLEEDDLDILSNMDLELPISSRRFWERRIRIAREGDLSINTILDRLGLRRGSGTRGVVSFQHESVKQLADAVAQAANALPVDDADGLVDIASRPGKMSGTVTRILVDYGDEVWGGMDGREREWLVDEEIGEGLWIEVYQDYLEIKEFVRLWIIVKAINTFNYLKYRKPGAKTKSLSKRGPSETVAEQPAPRQEIERELSPDEMDTSDDIFDNIVVERPRRRLVPATIPDVDGQQEEYISESTEDKIRETPQSIEHATTKSSDLAEAHPDPIAPTELDTEMENTAQGGSGVTRNELTSLLSSTEPRPEVSVMGDDPIEPSLKGAQPLESLTNLEDGNIAMTGDTPEKIGSALRKTKVPLDALSKSPAAVVVPGPSSARPARSTRNAMPTYNLAILNGRARHTPTKYLEKHHKNILHGSVDELRTGNPYNSSEIARFAQKGGRRSQTVSATPELHDQGVPNAEATNDESASSALPLKKVPKRRKRATSASSMESSTRPALKRTKTQKISNTPSAALTTSFSTYLQTAPKDPSTALPLLDTIKHDLALLTPHASALFSNPDLETTFIASMTAWLNVQCTIHSVRQRIALPPEPQHKPTHIKMARSRLLTELRIARDGYVNAQEDRAGTEEDVLCEGFEKMQVGKCQGKKVRKMVGERMGVLDGMLGALGDELGFGGGEWVRVGRDGGGMGRGKGIWGC